MLRIIILFCLFLSGAVFAKPVLTIYTYDTFASTWGPGPIVKKAFEQQCDCSIKYVTAPDGVTLFNRIKMEGKKSRADIVIGLDNNLLSSAQKSGLFTQHNINTSLLSLPIKWNNPYFLPFDYGYFSFIYNTTQIKNPPTSFDELINSKQPWRIIYQDPRTSTPGLGLLLWLQKLYGDDAANQWKKLAQKTVTVTQGWGEAYNLFLQGEADFVLSYTSSPAYHIIEQHNHHYKAVNFSEGHYLQIETAALLAHAKQPQLAHQFMQFILSPTFQATIPTKNWMYPVIQLPLPAAYQSLAVPKKVLFFPSDEISQFRTHWIKTWQKAVSE